MSAPSTGAKKPLAQAGSSPQPEAASSTLSQAPEVEDHPTPPSMRRRVLNMAWPIISQNFLETMLGIVDTLLVAGLGAAAIAGVGAAQQIMFFLIATLSALSVGSSVLVAQAVGAREHDRASGLTRQSLLWSVLLSTPLALVGLLLAGIVIGIFGLEPEVAQIGADYLQITMGTVVVLTLLLIGSGALRGAGDSQTPMKITAIANVINIGLSYGLIYGHFGLPALGAVGSAWGTFLARSLALAMLLYVLWQGRNHVSIRGLSNWLPSWTVARGVLQIGVPAAIEQVLITSAFLALTIVVAQLGTATLAAHRITFNALSLSFLPGVGFALAATALVGQSVGARRPGDARAVTQIATLWAAIWMGSMGFVIMLLAEPIMRLYSDDPNVIAIGVAGLRVVAFVQPLWALILVHSGALRGTGNSQFPLRANATGIWITVMLAYTLIRLLDGGLAEVWAAFLVTSPVMGVLLWWRFRRTVTIELHNREQAE